MGDEDENIKEYRWETGYEKTWEVIQEDDEGLLQSSVADIVQRAKRKRQLERHKNRRLGMMRHLFLIVDCSESMTNQDLKPTRQLCTVKLLENFVNEYFDQNPISQLGIITTQNKRAEKVSELAGCSRKHLKVIQQLANTSCVGEPSLQNALDLALRSLRLLPSHASREVLIVMGSLTTCDPGDITVTIEELKSHGVRCSVIGLAAEVHICHKLSRETGGNFSVILDDCHFRDLLLQHVDPPPASGCLDSSLIKMGFPHQSAQDGKDAPLYFCMCHIDASGSEGAKLNTGSYQCPQCCSKYCELPIECRACGLTLVSAPHLARSYHHLFPVDTYQEVDSKDISDKPEFCYACQKKFEEVDKRIYICPRCKETFCLDCDLFVHETLHTCPGCATNQQTFQVMGREAAAI